jgi:hypothetical protein
MPLIALITRKRWFSVTLIGLVAFVGSAAVGWVVEIREPEVPDEFSYLLAADTFSHGRLTNPAHQMWVHFENFHIIQQPTYMSKYPPAQGLALAAGQVIGGHPIVGVWLSFGFMCATICWMLYAWVGPRWALFGGFLALINPMLGVASYWAQSYWGGAVAATGGALVLGGIRRLMRQPHLHHALLVGVGLAILANSRPYEGLLFSLPAGIFLLAWILGKRGPAPMVSIQRIGLPILLVLCTAGLAMAFYNFRVTGDVFRTPYQVHEETYAMAPLFLWQSPRPEPAYHHEDLRHFYMQYNLSLYYLEYSIFGFLLKTLFFLRNFTVYFFNVFAIPLIAMFVLFFRWVLRNQWARFALILYGFFMCGMLLPVFWATHYLAPITGLNYFFIVSAMRLWRWRRKEVGWLMLWIVPFLAVLVLLMSVYKTTRQDRSLVWQVQRAKLLAQLKREGGQHLVIVSYSSKGVAYPLWEYNEADFDEAKVTWARGMDRVQNCKLMEYFKNRHIWFLEIHGDQSKPKLKLYPAKLCQ